jgi:voltage-gated potassium channel
MLILFLIVLSLVGFSIETLPDLSSSLKHILFILEVVIVGVFTLEYIARVLAAEKPLSYIFSFFGVIDLIAILPFYLATTVDLRSLRILRLFRLLTILKIARYNVALLRFSAALRSAFDELLLFTFASLLLIFIAAVGIYHFEHPQQPEAFRSIFDCLWWAVATLTTVGYGDVYPITIGGKLFTFAVLMIGLGLVAVPAGIISSALAQGRQNSNHSE